MIKTFKWSAPTQREDGSALDVSEIGGYRLYIDDEAIVDMPGSLNPDGKYEFQRDFAHGRYDAEITCIDTEGRESAKSNRVPFVVESAPSAVVDLSVS
jgi:hypothetical protein